MPGPALLREELNVTDFRPIVNVEGAVVKGVHYLMIVRGAKETHGAGTLSLPGGKLEPIEPQDNVLEVTLRREILEEVGVEIDGDMDYLESKFFLSDVGKPVVDVRFRCRYRRGMPGIIDPGEIAELHWMTADEILNHPQAPAWTRRSIQLAEDKRLSMARAVSSP